MIDLTIQLPDDLARRLKPVQDRLPEIIELGLSQLEKKPPLEKEEAYRPTKQQILDALNSTGIVSLPQPTIQSKPYVRHTPIKAGGPSAGEMIIKERRGDL